MIKYMLGVAAGMSVVPFAYLAQSIDDAGAKFYFVTAITPILVILGTAYAAKKVSGIKVN